MYHFLRKANLEAFSNQLLSVMAAAKDANQGRPTTELETLPASQHAANQVQPLAANQVHPVALMAANRVQPPAAAEEVANQVQLEARATAKGDNKKRRHWLISE
jgi:hypothetical protein